MDDLLNAPLWQKIVAVVLIVGVVVWGYYNFLYKPKVKKIESLKKQLHTVELELKLVAPPEMILKKGVDVRDLIKIELDELMKKIPTEKEVPYIIKDLVTEVGKGLNIDYNLIKPGAVKPEGKYKRLPLTVDFFGDYSDLNLYLKELKKLPATIRIDKLNLNRTSKPPEIQVKMVMSAFVMPGGTSKKGEFRAERKAYLFDPFFKLEVGKSETTKSEKQGYELQGIWYGEKVKRAFINNKVLSIGDKIDGFIVSRITKEEVDLKKSGVIITLKLEGEE